MSDSSVDKTNRNRRLLLSTGGVALALTATGAAQAAKSKATKATAYTVTRTRYGTTAEAYLPTVGDTYVLPLSAVDFTDGNADTTLNATNNTVTINTAGIYRVSLCVDWPGQHGVDHDLRTYGIRRRPAGTPPIVANGSDLTLIADTDQHLASQDVPGSDPPETVRMPGVSEHGVGGQPFPWTPGLIPFGGMVSIDVTMPVTGIIAPGDVALASHTAIADSVIGVAATTALIVNAKVVAADKVRVSIFNPTILGGVHVPNGNLQILGMNTILTRGESADAWTVLSTATERFAPGDVIYSLFSSLTAGDYMQTSDQVFLQFERWQN